MNEIKRIQKIGFTVITSIVLITSTLIGFASRIFLGNDNPIEEICEEIIEDVTGVEHIDLSRIADTIIEIGSSYFIDDDEEVIEVEYIDLIPEPTEEQPISHLQSKRRR